MTLNHDISLAQVFWAHLFVNPPPCYFNPPRPFFSNPHAWKYPFMKYLKNPEPVLAKMEHIVYCQHIHSSHWVQKSIYRTPGLVATDTRLAVPVVLQIPRFHFVVVVASWRGIGGRAKGLIPSAFAVRGDNQKNIYKIAGGGLGGTGRCLPPSAPAGGLTFV